MKNLFRISSVYLDIFIRFFLVLIKKDLLFYRQKLKNLQRRCFAYEKKKINKIVNILFKFFSQN